MGVFLGYFFVVDCCEFYFLNFIFGVYYCGLLNFFGDQIEVYFWLFGGDWMIFCVVGLIEIGLYYLYDFEVMYIELFLLIWFWVMEVQIFEMQLVSWIVCDGFVVSGYVIWFEVGFGLDIFFVVMFYGGFEVCDSIGFDFML